MATAKQLAWRKKFAAMARAGTLRKNPTKKKSVVRKVATTKKITRPSQATKTKPTRRLVARRKATLLAPPGYFANPEKTQKQLRESAKKGNLHQFAIWVTDTKTGKRIAGFVNRIHAIEYAHAYANKTGHSVSVG